MQDGQRIVKVIKIMVIHLMNRTILATVFVASTLVTGMLFAGIAFQDADAIKPNPKTKPFKGTFSGTFMTPDFTAFPIVATAATSSGIYTHLGSSASTGTFFVDFSTFGALTNPNCITVLASPSTTTAANGDTVTFILGGVFGTQCFFDSGLLPATSLASFCGGAAGDPHTSTVSVDYTITGGDGRFVGATGSGTVSSAVNHCDLSVPSGNSFTATTSGTINYAASNKS